jgi:long-subunit fatty acid transport protein
MPDELARCAPGGTRASFKTCLDVKLPQLLTVGARYVGRDAKGDERFDVELDLRWENWGWASDDVAVIDARDTLLGAPVQAVVMRHGFRDVFAVRAGGSLRFGQLSLRGGVSHDTAAAPPSWIRLDKDGKARTAFAAGAAWQHGGWRFDAGLALVLQPDVVVTDVPLDRPSYDQRQQPDVQQPSQHPYQQPFYPINAGVYESGYLIALIGTTRSF